MPVRVLIVDEVQMSRACYRALLERVPDVVEVHEATGDDTLAASCANLAPNLIVVDVDNGTAGAADLVRQTLAAGNGAALIALSSRPEARQVEVVLHAGAAGYVLKKHGLDELAQAVHTVMGDDVYISPGLLDDREDDGEDDDQVIKGRTPLTAREREVLSYVAQGLSSRNIAQTLGLSLKTVETHRLHISNKLEIHSVAGLTKYAIREGLTAVDQ